MEESGRGFREKIPSAKLKDSVHIKLPDERPDPLKSRMTVPTYIAPFDARFEQEQKAISKTYDHTKHGKNGERTDFYVLGNHVESRDKRSYIRARRDPRTLYFHTAEAPPFYARLSDENHPQCGIETLHNVFTQDMLGKTGEFGSYTTRANVFAREGQFFYETKVVSIAPPGREDVSTALGKLQSNDRTSTDRGGLRIGFCRREHGQTEPLGSDGYGYGLQLRTGVPEYGSVRFNSLMYKINGTEIGDLQAGDVVGLMITLPPLSIHKQVVDGTFNPSEHPHLKCGPAKPKTKSKQSKKTPKSAISKDTTTTNSSSRARDSHHGNNDDNSSSSNAKHNTSRGASKAATNKIRASLKPKLDPTTGTPIQPVPIDHDIIRDRNPFLHKSSLVYFECPEYTQHIDLQRPSQNSKQKTKDPETEKAYDIAKDGHPCHDLAHLRTLPGSKIEAWVNGVYKGIVWEHLFAFLPPASFIEKSSKTNTHGEVDDGMLGYYPAMTHYTGGAFECKFDQPWWFGFDPSSSSSSMHPSTSTSTSTSTTTKLNQDPKKYPNAKPIGTRYNEQIVEDVVADLVDEICLEKAYGDVDWMRREVVKAAGGNSTAISNTTTTTAIAATNTTTNSATNNSTNVNGTMAGSGT